MSNNYKSGDGDDNQWLKSFFSDRASVINEVETEQKMQIMADHLEVEEEFYEWERKGETFNAVAEHLILQAKKSVIDRGFKVTCAYRGTEDCKCAIGALISEETYVQSIEGKSVSSLDLNLIDGRYTRDKDFLSGLQAIHDNYRVESWPYKLQELAFYHSIDCPEWLKTTDAKSNPIDEKHQFGLIRKRLLALKEK